MLRLFPRRGRTLADRISSGIARAERHRRHRLIPIMDALEQRRLLTTFDVTNTSDSGAGSLRQAMLDSNATTGSNYIAFEIPASTAASLNVPVSGFNTATQLWTITLASALPTITNPVNIDGLSEAHVGQYYNYPANFSSETDSLTIDPSVTGGTYQINIASYTDQVGVARGGTTATIPYDATAAYVQGQLSALVGTGNVTVSGPTSAQSSAAYVITFAGNSTGLAISETITNSNLIGTNPVATLAVETAGGVASGTPTEILASPNATAAIDGNNAENRVVIDGSAVSSATGFVVDTSYAMIRGLDITGFTTGVSIPLATNVGDLVQGNFIGDYLVHPVDPIKGSALPAPNNEYVQGPGNLGIGVAVFGTNTTVGGASAQDDNVITNNAEQGIFIEPGAEGAQVLGNQIGVIGPSSAGVYYRRPNGEQGVLVQASSNRIGTAGAGNIISANDGDGIAIIGATATQNVVAANYLGAAPQGGYIFGNGTPGNQGDGVDIENAPNNVIGQTSAGNVISSNANAGIVVTGTSAVSNIIADNIIGLTSDGTQVLGNGQQGIAIYSASTTVGPSNVVSGNNVGILVSGASATSVNITGNLIGTDETGEGDLGNAQQGILVENATGVTIQGNAAGSQVISGNNVGIEILGTSSNALILGNFIGTDKAGSLELPNAQQGVFIENSANNTIGGASLTSKNLISANYWGIMIDGAGSTGNLVAGNQIGTDITSVLPLGNEVDGILISNGAASNTIGGTSSGLGNQIAFNTDAGIEVSSSNQNSFLSNISFSNGAGAILLDGTSNNSQVAPNITGVGGGGTTANLYGTLDGTVASTTFLIQFFSNTVTDPGGLYEAQNYLGSTTVTTNASGDAQINYNLSGGIAVGDFITATATNLATGDTSALSNTTVITAVSAQAVSVNFSSATYLVNSTAGTVTIAVNRSGNVNVSVSVSYATANGSAVSGQDYTAATGTLTFVPGVTTQSFQIPILNNTRSQTSESTVNLSLSGPIGGATLGNVSTAILIISNSSASVSAFIVSNTNDSGPGSLRAAILSANSSTSSAPISIQFNIPASVAAALNVPVPGFNPSTQIWTINLLTALPDVTVPVDIDGYSEGNVGVPYRYPSALTSQVDSLAVDGSVSAGSYQLTIPTYTDNSGISRGGTIANIPYNASATYLQDQLDTIVGSGNASVTGQSTANGPGSYSVNFQGQSTGLAVSLEVTSESLTGTNPVATVSVVTQGGAILNSPTEITSVPNSVAAIDGNNAQNRVLINGSGIDPSTNPVGFVLDTSYATLRGLIITGFATGVSVPQPGDVGDLVQGNSIGAYIVYPVDPILGSALPAPYSEYLVGSGNTGAGILIYGTNATIGGASTQDDNIIGDNAAQGIVIEPGAEGAQVLGNQIGVIGPSSAGVYWHDPNGQQGILIEASSNRIGAEGAGNIISANLGDGVEIEGTSATQNVIAANYIGDAPGGGYLFGNGTPGNEGDGVDIQDAPNNIIGQTSAGNVISSNANAGIVINGLAATSNIIADNIIGLTADGIQVLGNGQQGIAIYSASTTVGPSNVVSGNNVGILVSGASATSVNITGNLIGTDETGEGDLGNAQQGILVENATGVTIQGNAAGSQVISGNNVGIEILGTSSNALILGNFIGTDKAGSLALPNAQQGVFIENSANNTIGGASLTSKNLISANYWGIMIDGAGSTGNLVAGNLIGTDLTGLLPLGNEVDGILISGTASSNTIGGTIASQGNTIGFNSQAGVYVLSGNGNPILSNSIFSNGQIGIRLGASGNNAIVSPALITAATSPTSDTTDVRGTYTSQPDLAFLIQFFSNPGPDPAGQYEGQTLLGYTTVTTNASGVATFSVSLPTAVASGSWITATATFLTIAAPPPNLNSGDTSQFSGAVQAINPFLVITTADSFSNPTPGMLRYAIEYSNLYPSASASSPNVIQFQIPGDVLQTILLQAALPVITSPAVIDGFSQPGSQTNDSSQFVGVHANDDQETDIAIVMIQISGAEVTGSNAIGLEIAAPGSTIDGLSITAFSGAGIELSPGFNPATASLGDTIWGNEIGVIGFSSSNYNPVNSATNINANGIGILVNSPNNVIGGTVPPDRNIIQGNASDGVVVYGTQGTSNAIETNFILDNGGDGVLLLSATNQVGTASGIGLAGGGNLISGNALSGVHILGPAARGNSIENNQIGTQVGLAGQVIPILGTKARPNGNSGVTIENAPSNVVGGQIANSGNTLAGDAFAGATIENYVSGQVPPIVTGVVVNPPLNLKAATLNSVQGNQIGFNVRTSQVYLIPNLEDGLSISSASNLLGGTTSSARNIIIDNARNGIAITADTLDSSNNPTGSIPNAQPNFNLIEGNYIGTQAGTDHFGNAVDGVLLVSAVANTIGGTVAGAPNVVSANAGDGIEAFTSTSNLIAGNEIGSTADGSTALGNIGDGIALVNSAGNTIGGTLAAAANLIAANANGVHLSGAGTGSNTILGNLIGTNSSGGNLLGNAFDGVLIDTGASANQVGSLTSGAGNTIAFNAATGVAVSVGTGNSILSNSIFSNGNLGIILTNNGNNAIPAPIITSATPLPNSTTIQGNFSDAALPSTSILIQVFSNAQADPSGFGEGQTLLGSTTLMTNSSGFGTFNLVLAAGVAPGLNISATATNIVSGDTSPFSSDVVNTPQIQFSSSTYIGGEPLSSFTVTVVRNTTLGGSTVNYAATPGTATANVDFTPVSGTLAFVSGQSTATFSVPINSAPAGSGNFTIQLTLSNPTSAILGSPSTAILEIASIPGSLAFSSSSYQVAAGSGVVPITVVRTVGASGTVTVNYTAVYSQAFPANPTGMISGTLVFAPGVTQQSIALPVPPSGASPYNSVAAITLTSTTGGALIVPPAFATLTITQPLTVTSEQIIATNGAINAIQISFSAALDAFQAENLSNYGYYAIASGTSGTFIDSGVNAVKLASAIYDPATQSVTINPSTPLRLGTFYRITVDGLTNGILVNGVTDTFGGLLAGNGSNPGTPFVITFAAGNHLAYTDGSGNLVSLNLNHGGIIEMFRVPSGTAQQITLVGTTPKSALSGKVVRFSHSSGRTTLPTISAPAGGKLKLPAGQFSLSSPPITSDSVFLAVSSTRLKALVRTAVAKPRGGAAEVSFVSTPTRPRSRPAIKRAAEHHQTD